MNNITVNMENLNTEERAQLVALIEKANAPKSKLWKPNDKEYYYFICSDGIVERTKYISGSPCEDYRLLLGNCFKTEAEAEFEAERLKVIAELRRFASNERNASNHWYYLYCGARKGAPVICGETDFNTGELHFKTRDDALAAIQAVGEHRIKKYYFGMED